MFLKGYDSYGSVGHQDHDSMLINPCFSANDPVLSVQHKDSVTCASFNHNGTLFASADLSGTIVITQLSDLSIKCEVGNLEL